MLLTPTSVIFPLLHYLCKAAGAAISPRLWGKGQFSDSGLGEEIAGEGREGLELGKSKSKPCE